jgi:hypothetical protein
MKTKTILLIFSGIIFLAGGAYFAGRLFNNQANPFSGTITSPDGSTTSMTIDMEMTPAAEVPVLPEIASGIYIDHVDNIITINEFSTNAMGGNSEVVVSVSEDGSISADAGDDAKKTEVLINTKTKIYRDDTDLMKAVDEGKKSIQQILSEGNIDEMNNMTFLSVWGRKNGDRIIADTIIYTSPLSIKSSDENVTEPDN